MTKGIMICGERRCNWRGPEPAIFTATTLREEIAKAELRGRESMRQESDSLARACNLADVDYETFLKIKAYMPVHPAPKPMTDEGILILAAACQVTDPDLGLGMTDYGNSSKELIDFARAIEARCKC